MTVLNIYLLNGIQESAIKENKSLKFFNVGLMTKKRGGNSHNSFAGLSEVEIVYTKGKIIKIPISERNNIKIISPPTERDTFFLNIECKIDINQVPTLFRSLRITALQKIITKNNIVARVQAYPISYRVVP